MTVIRVLIADESRQVTDNISRRLALEEGLEVCGTASNGESAVQEALWLKPDIAIVDAGLPGMDGGQTTEMLIQALPGTGVIMMSMEAENDAYRLAMLAGAREFLQKPFKGDDLVAAVRRVHAFEQRRGVSAPAPAVAAAATSAPSDPGSGVAAAPAVSRRGVVTAVISGKGGVGKTVIAINIAAALAEKHAGAVVLVDLSLQYGDVGAALDLPTDHSITDLLAENGTADADMIRQVLVNGPGFQVLLAPTSPELADYVSPAHLTDLIATLRSEFDYIIVDTPSYLNEVSIHTVELADHLVMVTDLSVTGIKNARLTRGVLETLEVDPAKVIVVGNHRDGVGGLDRRGAETFLGAHISVEIPFAADVVATSVNKGVPFVVSSPDAPTSSAVRSIVAAIDPLSRNGSEPAPNGDSSDKKKRTRRKLSFSR
ncbi:MAG: response regulator [Candidatus Dormibacteraeota bacterium]|nr:response regulator [Candidatus Dormibacteraeota bacterium]